MTYLSTDRGQTSQPATWGELVSEARTQERAARIANPLRSAELRAQYNLPTYDGEEAELPALIELARARRDMRLADRLESRLWLLRRGHMVPDAPAEVSLEQRLQQSIGRRVEVELVTGARYRCTVEDVRRRGNMLGPGHMVLMMRDAERWEAAEWERCPMPLVAQLVRTIRRVEVVA